MFSYQIQAGSFAEIDKLIETFIWKCKEFRIAKTILKKKKVGGLTLQTYYGSMKYYLVSRNKPLHFRPIYYEQGYQDNLIGEE